MRATITAVFRAADGALRREEARDALPPLPGEGTVWLDFSAATEAERRLLAEEFRFHPLAVEDAVAQVQFPKVDDYGQFLFLALHEAELGAVDGRLETRELDVFLTPRFLVTYHRTPLRCLEALAEGLNRNRALLERPPAFLLHALLEHLVGSYLPVLDALEERTEAVEEAVFRRDGRGLRGLVDEILALKRELAGLRRFAVLQREVLRSLAAGEHPLIPGDLLMYFRDVYDHLVRVSDLAESYRDLLSSVLEAYLTTVSNRLNEVMKLLTIIATIMMPLTLITGIYGMNFEHLPLARWPGGFWAVLAGMGVLAAAMVAAFRRAGWL